jgi:putative peptide zinc metalloprotease protein
VKQRILVFVAVALLAAGFSAARPAFAHADNAAIAVNTKDGTTVFKVAFAIRHVMSDVVDETNAAVAYNSCNDCAAVAVAFELVLVESNPSVVTPQNISIAMNENCSTCVAVAEAYQFVLGGDTGPVHFDQDGNKILAEIRKELHSLRKEDLTLAELQARLDAMAARIEDVLAHHLVPSGKPNRAPPPQEPTATATTEPTPTTSPTTTSPTTTSPPTTSTSPTTSAPTTTEETTTTTPTTPTTTGATTTTGP